MDSMDRSILKCLSENSRRSATDISQAVHLSVAAVIERIRKMERKGIIQQYTIVADQHKLGNDVTALMEVSLEHLHRIIKSIRGVSATKTYFVLKEIKCGQTAVGEV